MTQTTQKIPDGWSVKRLDEIGDFISGTGFPEKEQGGIEGVPFYKVSDMNLPENSIYMVKSNNYVTENQIRQMHVKPILKKSILFAKVGAAIFLERKRIAENFLCDNNMMCFSPLIFSLFYKYYFDILRLSKYVQVGALPSYNASDLANIKILLPPLAEQEKIAEILGTWDSAIEKLTALIAAKRLQKKGLMQKLLTAQIRLPGFTGEWQKVKLGEIASISKGEQLGRLEMTETGIYPVINGGISKSGLTDSYNREKDTITISEGGNSCGFAAFMKERFWCGGHCYALSNLQTNLHFLFQILKFEESDIMRLRVGSGLPNIQKSSLDSFSLCIPTDISEQKAIADILSKADEEIDLLTRKLDLLQSQKKGLMQQLLTGKIRVKVA